MMAKQEQDEIYLKSKEICKQASMDPPGFWGEYVTRVKEGTLFVCLFVYLLWLYFIRYLSQQQQ